MRKGLNQYFFDLEGKDMAHYIDELSFNDKIQRIYLPNGSYYVKNAQNKPGVISVASSKMYQALGIKTPLVFLLKGSKKSYIQTIEQEVQTINKLIYTLAKEDVSFSKINTIICIMKVQV